MADERENERDANAQILRGAKEIRSLRSVSSLLVLCND